MSQIKDHILSGSKKLGMDIQSFQAAQMEDYAIELMAWNKKINLTAIKNPLQVAEKHFIDSMAAGFHIKERGILMDMGSGGGFPGLVLKIIKPDTKIVLVDSVRKKVSFLNHVIRLLKLENIKAVHSRIEDLHTDQDYNGVFDTVISRAFADMSKYVPLALPFVNHQGVILAMKSNNGLSEITPRMAEQFHITHHEYQLPFEKAGRIIIQLNQIKN